MDSCLELAAPLVEGAELNRQSIAARLEDGHLDATTLMEALIRRGMAQRTAHGVVGKLVRKSLDRGARLADLTLDEFRSVDPSFDSSVYEVLGAQRAVGAFTSYGSTAPDQVDAQLLSWQRKLGLSKTDAAHARS